MWCLLDVSVMYDVNTQNNLNISLLNDVQVYDASCEPGETIRGNVTGTQISLKCVIVHQL